MTDRQDRICSNDSVRLSAVKPGSVQALLDPSGQILTSLFIAGDVLWLLGLPAGLCSMAGAALGSRLTIRNGSKMIRGMMLFVLILLLVKMITDMLQ